MRSQGPRGLWDVGAPRRRYGLLLWALLVAALVAGGVPYYRWEMQRVQQKKLEMLQAVAELKIQEIRAWRKQRVEDANWSGSSPLLRRALIDYFAGRNVETTKTLLSERLAMERDLRGYVNVLLLGPDRRVAFAARSEDTELGPDTNALIDEALRKRAPALGFLFRDRTGHVRLDTAAPIFDGDGVLQGVSVMRADPNRDLFPLIQSWPVPSESAEILLVTRDGSDVLLLNELRHKKDTATSFRIPLSRENLPTTQVVLGRRGLWQGNDYRGIPVLAYLAPIADSPWFMVAKVDSQEIFADAQYREGVILGALVMLAALTGISISLLLHWRRARVFRDLYRSERQKREAQEEFRATLYSIADAVITTDRQGIIKQMNAVAERLTGWSEAEAKGQAIEDVFRIINELSRQATDNPVMRVLRQGEMVSLTNHTLLIARGGQEYPIAQSAAAIRDSSNEIRGVVLVFHDIVLEQSHREATAELAARGEMLNTVAEGIGLARQSDGAVLFANPALEHMFGYATGELLGRSIDSLLPSDGSEPGRPPLMEALPTQGAWNDDHHVQRKDGTRFWCNCEITTWTHPRHGPVWIWLTRDISKRRELEGQYRQAQKMDAVGRLAGGVAHDFNNMLASLTMQIDMLYADVGQGLTAGVPERLKEMLTTTKHASSLTRQLLLFSRRQTVAMARLDLDAVVAEMARLLGRILGERIQVVTQPSLAPVWIDGDHGMLEQVIMNLALNARDAMTEGGRLEMLCDVVELSPEQACEIRGGRSGTFVRLRVVDTGVGMSDEVRAHLFEPFFTTKERGKGTGLGLATAQSIVIQHQGFLDAQGTPGKGSTFSMFLPRQEPGQVSGARPMPTAVKAEGERVLLVEDENGLRDLAGRQLKRLGYQVTAAASGEEALRIWQEQPGAFDLLFTDMVMPGQVSGLDLCRRLRQDVPHMPVVITSGYSLDLAKEAETRGCNLLFLPKPYDSQALSDMLRRAFKRQASP